MARIESSRTQRETFEQLPLQRKIAAGYDKALESYRDGELVVIDGEDEPSIVTIKVRAAVERLF
jgi:thymidylate kinase